MRKKNSEQQSISILVELFHTLCSELLNGDVKQSFPLCVTHFHCVLQRVMDLMCNKSGKELKL